MESAPNIIFVLADQLGARWLPIYGHPSVSTPNLTKFSSHSTVFEHAITTSPVCTPYRGCLLSGCYPSQTGVLENGHSFPTDLPSLADHLNEQGYATYYVGKWHLSGAPQENRWVPPEKRAGFQHFIGWESHHVNHFAGRIWSDDPDDDLEMPGHETDALTDIALRQLAEAAHDDAPFFLMLSYQAPHPPCSPPKQYIDQYGNRDLISEPNADKYAWFKHESWKADYDIARFRQLYFGEISHLDAAFGRLMSTIDDLGLRGNTLIIFTSDHGEMAGAHGVFGKGVMFEEALQVPLIVQAPGQKKGLRANCPAATIDVMPTLMDYANCQAETWTEGISLRPLVEGHSTLSDRIVISEYHNFCARTRHWKLVTDGRALAADQLYNIREDPYELCNRLNDPTCASIQGELSQSLACWHEQVVLGQMKTSAIPTHLTESAN